MRPLKIRQYFPITATVCRITDGLSIAMGLFLALHWRPELDRQAAMLVAVTAIVAMFIIGECLGMYRSWRGAASEKEVVCSLLTWGCALLVLLVLGMFSRFYDHLSRGMLLAWFVSAPTLMLAFRTVIRTLQRSLRAHGMNTCNYAIVGVNPLSLQLAQNIERNPEIGLRLVGFFDDRPDERIATLPPEYGAKTGGLKCLLNLARNGKIDTVYVTFPMRAEQRIRNLLTELSDTTASVYIVPDFFVFELLHSRWSDIGGLPAVSIFEDPFYGIHGIVKRLTDIVLASFGLVLLADPDAVHRHRYPPFVAWSDLLSTKALWAGW